MDVSIADLWLSILVGAVLVFVAGSILWMVSPHHKPDIKPLPDEEAFKSAITGLNIPPGMYMWPHCHTPDGKKVENAAERYKAGPWGLITVSPGMPNFAKNLAINFIEGLVIVAISAYITSIAVPAGADYLHVFRYGATAAFLGFALGQFSGDAFLGKPARFQFMSFIDALIYTALAAGAIAAFWPEAGVPGGGEGLPIPTP